MSMDSHANILVIKYGRYKSIAAKYISGQMTAKEAGRKKKKK